MKRIISLLIAINCLACNDYVQVDYINQLPDRDPAHQELPEYSEMGYNTFGAYYNDLTFTADVAFNRNVYPFKIISDSNAISFRMTSYVQPDPTDSLSLTFSTHDANFKAVNYTDLIAYSGKIYDLTKTDCNIILKKNGTIDTLQITAGYFEFKRAQLVNVNGIPKAVILSGTFEFAGTIKEQPINITFGRFDMSADDYNFTKTW